MAWVYIPEISAVIKIALSCKVNYNHLVVIYMINNEMQPFAVVASLNFVVYTSLL